MHQLKKALFFAALVTLWGTLPSQATPLLTISPSTQAPLQGQAITLTIGAASGYAGDTLYLSAALDGQSVGLQHPSPNTWIVAAGPYNSLGQHLFNFSLSLENTENSRKDTASIWAVQKKIVILNDEIAAATDLTIKKALLGELAGQENILSMLENQLANLRTAIGSQDYSFYVEPNTINSAFPLISSVSPNSGSVAGGTNITIMGSNFGTGTARVLVGGVAASNVAIVNTTTITAVTPALSSLGAQNVEVDLPPLSGSGPRNSILPGAFYALPPATPTPNDPPVAVTSGSQVFLLGNAAQIDASQSFDWGGLGLNYAWNFISTPTGSSFQAGYAFPNASSVSFTPDVYGTYVLELVVQQSSGASPLSSSPSLAVVSAVGAPAPTAPALSVAAGGTGTSQVQAHDPTPGAGESYSVQTAPQHGTASINAYGLLTYTAAAGYAGADQVVVRVMSQYGLSAELTIAVTVTSAKKISALGAEKLEKANSSQRSE